MSIAREERIIVYTCVIAPLMVKGTKLNYPNGVLNERVFQDVSKNLLPKCAFYGGKRPF